MRILRKQEEGTRLDKIRREGTRGNLGVVPRRKTSAMLRLRLAVHLPVVSVLWRSYHWHIVSALNSSFATRLPVCSFVDFGRQTYPLLPHLCYNPSHNLVEPSLSVPRDDYKRSFV